MKNIALAIILAFCLLNAAQGQNFAGGLLPHFFTGYKTVDMANPIPVDPSFNAAIGAGIFDLTEDIHIATSLREYTIEWPSSASTLPTVAHIQVINPKLSDNRQSLLFSLKLLSSFGSVTSLAIRQAGFNFIVIGSLNGGFYTISGIPSNYIFARNADMITTSGTGIVDFKTGNSVPSPFLYDPSTDTGCGAVKRNGAWILERKNCTKAPVTLFITGFEISLPNTDTNGETNFITANTKSQFDLIGGDFTFGAAGSVGLTIDLTSNYKAVGTPSTNFIQLSMVVIALREYSAGIYPFQGKYIDTFTANAAIDTGTLSSYNDFSSTGDTITLSNSPATNEFPYAGSPLETQYGHRFCGYRYLGVKRTKKLDSTNGFISGFTIAATKDPNPFQGTTKILFTQTTVPVTLNVPVQIVPYVNCLQFVARNPTCIEQTSKIGIGAPTTTISSTNGAADATVIFTGGSATSYTDQYPIPSVEFFANQVFTSATGGTVTYQSTTKTPAVAGVYEGDLFISLSSGSFSGLTANDILTVTINVFGNEVVKKTIISGSSLIATSSKNINLHFTLQNANVNNNKITITTTSSTAFSTSSSQSLILQFGLYQQKNIIDLDGKCVSACSAPPAGQVIGIDYTANPPKCVTCDATANLFFDTTVSPPACKCKDGFFFVSGACSPCTPSLCASCTTVSKCERCVDGGTWIDPTDHTKGCKCADGYYQSGSTCLKCSSGCTTCTTGETCTTCVVNSNTRKTEIDNCVCKPGYYETGAAVCPTCSSECLTCSKSATNCTSCDETKFFLQSGTTCVCQTGYYVALINGQAQCLKCSPTCAECVNDPLQCKSCPSDQWTFVGTKCVCNKVLRYITYSNSTVPVPICISGNCLNLDPNCVSCYAILTNSQTRCSLCNEAGGWTLNSDNKTCSCKSGYVRVADKCQQCGKGCAVCTSATSCTTCANGAMASAAGTCDCLPGSYLSSSFGSLQCLPCNQNCLECQTEPSLCSRCTNGFVTDNLRCVCPTGRYVTDDGVYCNVCQTGCAKCSSALTCDACQTGYILSPVTGGSKCLLNCPAQTYNAGDQCASCSDFCLKCVSAYDCRSCQTGYFLYLGSCRPSCPAGTYAYQGTVCFLCSPSCATCSNANSCLSCAQGLVLSGTQCLANCPDGFFYNGIMCAACASTCGKCTGTAVNCLSCPAGQYFYNSQCYTTCPTAMVNGICTNVCQDGFYLSGTACVRCSSSCVTCSSSTTCTSCKTGLLTYKGQCLTTCPTGTLKSVSSCDDCDINCVGCSGSVNSCINCKPGTFRLADRCLSVCPVVFYADPSTNTCKQCDSGCKVCSGPGACTTCISGQPPVNGLCAPACGIGCLDCQNNRCVKCSPNTYWNGVACVSTCPAGSNIVNGICVCASGQALYLGNCVVSCPSQFTPINGQCTACESPCATCTTSTTTCASCVFGFTFDKVAKKCVKNTNCDFGLYYSNFGDCRFICIEGSFYLDIACYKSCPSGFIGDARTRTCVKNTLPSGCTAPLYLQGTTCVNNCNVGFYPDDTSRVCLPCSTNCAICSGPLICTSCNAGSTLSNGVCVTSPLVCPPNQFRYLDLCVTSCPTGTFRRNGFCVRQCAANFYLWQGGCYRTCPLKLRTADACVVSCPAGQIAKDSVCTPIVAQRQCGPNKYWSSTVQNCESCSSTCQSCFGTSTFCISCAPGFELNSAKACVKNSCPAGFYSSSSTCKKCSDKCATCTDLNTCTSCSAGFANTGADCVKSTADLTEPNLKLEKISKRGKTVFVEISIDSLLPSLSSNLESQIFLVITKAQPNPMQRINMWVTNNQVIVAIEHLTSNIPSYEAHFILNSAVFNELFKTLRYTAANVFLKVPISNNVENAQASLSIPKYAAFSRVDNDAQSSYNKGLNSIIAKSLSVSKDVIRN